MNIFFRVDSSIQIGTGHLMRCLTLADALCEKKATVSFICRELPGNICDFVEKKGFKVYRLPYKAHDNSDWQSFEYAQWLCVTWGKDAEQTRAILVKVGRVIDWLVVDHYALDKQWEIFSRPYVKKIMVIDDLAARPHNCDLLLDQNHYENMKTRYEGLVPNHCQKLLGPRYALLRLEFKEARKNLRQHDGNIKRVLIFFGGSDPTNETEKALEAICFLNRPDIAVDVVVGTANPHKERIKQLCAALPYVTFHCQVNDIAQLMVNADLSIGGGGTATWERCCVGLPSLVVTIADNQRDVAKNLFKVGIIINLGWYEEVKKEDIRSALENLLDMPDIVQQMRVKGMQLVDGYGTNRVVEELIKN